jgi:hypothetical protein
VKQLKCFAWDALSLLGKPEICERKFYLFINWVLERWNESISGPPGSRRYAFGVGARRALSIKRIPPLSITEVLQKYIKYRLSFGLFFLNYV